MSHPYITSEYLQTLPQQPGVYKYFDDKNTLIYVGKAKNLKNRVSSYFQKSNQHSTKTVKLVQQIRRIEFLLVETEFDAFLLENALIKENLPKYNIMLRDDKTYPYICLTNETFPRLLFTRTLDRSKGKYFGPFSNVKAVSTLLELLHKTFKIRTCSLVMNPNSIAQNKFSVCLEYHIGNCLGPCEGHQNLDNYLSQIERAEMILKGEIHRVHSLLEKEMYDHASNYEFEKAQKVKIQLEDLENFQSKSIISNPRLLDIDVFSITSNEEYAFINYLKTQNGTITIGKNFFLKKKLDETNEELLSFAILATRLDINSKAPEIITNIELPDLEIPNTLLFVPKIGDKRKLVDLSLKNVLQYKKDKTPKEKRQAFERVLEQMKSDLKLKSLPLHIECFDNSNIQGSNPVASMVCFKNGTPSKKDYRHFNIKTVEGPNDFDSMKEIVSRRYSRLLSENKPLPDLIIIDGGKGQLSAAKEAMESIGIYGKVPVIGIAKRLEEIYYPNDSFPLLISKKSETLILIQKLRNEAHRFAITFHRQKRSINFIKSDLENIAGIGPKTIELLLQTYKSVAKIKALPFTELETLIGNDKATKVFSYFENNNTNKS